MRIRTYRPNFRLNYALQPSKWNRFWSALEMDIRDLLAEIKAITFSFDYINNKSDEVTKIIGEDKRLRFKRTQL